MRGYLFLVLLLLCHRCSANFDVSLVQKGADVIKYAWNGASAICVEHSHACAYLGLGMFGWALRSKNDASDSAQLVKEWKKLYAEQKELHAEQKELLRQCRESRCRG